MRSREPALRVVSCVIGSSSHRLEVRPHRTRPAPLRGDDKLVLVHRLNPDVLALWGDVELLGRAPGGHVNDVHFARVNGEDCVVRVAKRRGEPALQWELDLLEDLHSHGLRAPEIVPTPDGWRHVDGVVVYRLLRGRHPETPADWRKVAEYLARLHELGLERPQRPEFVMAIELVNQDSGSDIELRHMPADAVARCRAAWERLESVPPTLVHGDPGQTNILINGDGVALIDWDEARIDCSWFDLAALPDEVCPLAEPDRWVARQAANAWEAALTWESDRKYAEWRLSQVSTPSRGRGDELT